MTKKNINSFKSAEEVTQFAIEWQDWQTENCLSWGEFADWGSYFEQLANKFPEVKEEFEANAII
jgi:hypothetical protein